MTFPERTAWRVAGRRPRPLANSGRSSFNLQGSDITMEEELKALVAELRVPWEHMEHAGNAAKKINAILKQRRRAADALEALSRVSTPTVVGGEEGASCTESTDAPAFGAAEDAQRKSEDEIAWLIEETWSGFVHYVHRDFNCADWATECRRDDDRRRYGLPALMRVPIVTKNVEEAMRFPTRDAAELWKAFQPRWMAEGEQYAIREHLWPALSAHPPSGAATVKPCGSEEGA